MYAQRRNKLSSKVTGPLKVIKRSSHTVTIINAHGYEDTVSLDRTTFAPSADKDLIAEGRLFTAREG